MFHGKWLSVPDVNSDTRNLHFWVKKSFNIDDFSSARIRITADDYYKLYINGTFVGQGPAQGYHFSYYYNEYDITNYLHFGDNEILVHVYYQGLCNRAFVSADSKQGMIVDLYVDDSLFISTDSTWLYSIDNTFLESKTVGYDTAFLENRDFRLCNSDYMPCVASAPNYSFNPMPFPSLQVYSVKTPSVVIGNKLFYDFGREYVSNIKLSVNSKIDGSRVVIRCAEELNDDGTLRYNMRCNCDYQEYCILPIGDTVIDQFDYKAFRYMELELDAGVTVTDVELLVRHYPFPDDARSITTDDTALQMVFDLCRDTIKYGTQETFVDCPTREKGQYIGDAFISGFSHLILTRDPKMLKKAITNIAESLRYSGDVLSVSPCAFQQKIADYSLLFPLLLWRYYQYTSDLDLLRSLLFACDHLCDCFAQYVGDDGLLYNVRSQWNLVDWPDTLRDGYDFDLSDPVGDGCHNVINAFYISCVDCTQRIKNELGVPYDDKLDDLISSYNNAFFSKDTGLYVDCIGSNHSSVHSNMLPLSFGICDPDSIGAVSQYLVDRGIVCGTYMSYFYLDALCKAGKREQAYSAIVSDSKNGWLNMIKEGATTTFEAWSKDQKWNTSLFHPWSTAPIIILYEYFNEFF